jgi:hypothetical protein
VHYGQGHKNASATWNPVLSGTGFKGDKTMIKLPHVIGLYPCERIDFNTQSGQVSLVGVFHSLHFRRFPALPRKFTVYAALYDGVGEGTIDLVVTQLETELDIYAYEKWYVFPGRGRLCHVGIPVTQCGFAAPGRYAMTLRFEGSEITQRLIDIFKD